MLFQPQQVSHSNSILLQIPSTYGLPYLVLPVSDFTIDHPIAMSDSNTESQMLNKPPS